MSPAVEIGWRAFWCAMGWEKDRHIPGYEGRTERWRMRCAELSWALELLDPTYPGVDYYPHPSHVRIP